MSEMHDRYLELAAAAIDFELTPAERRALDAHLDRCVACRRRAVLLRADAVSLSQLPSLQPRRTTSPRVGWGPTVRRLDVRPLRLVAVAALLTLLALATLAVGNELLRRDDGLPSLVSDASPSAAPASPIAAGPTEAPASGAPTLPEDAAELTVGWARAGSDGVELFDRAGGAQYGTLEPREAVYVTDQATVVDGVAWYPIDTLSGRSGWATGGPAHAPAITMITEDRTIFPCGPVESTDPVVLEGVAVPNVAFDEITVGTLELAMAVRGEGCVLLSAEPDGPRAYVDAAATACGEPRWDGSSLRLAPTLRGALASSIRVRSTVAVRDVLLTEAAVPGPDGRTNRHNVLLLAASGQDPVGCITARVTDRQDVGRDMYFMAESAQCIAVVERTSRHVVLEPAAGSDPFRFDLTVSTSIDGLVAAGSIVAMNVTAMYPNQGQEFFSLVPVTLPDCPVFAVPQFEPGTVVETVSDRLRVRSQPRVSNDSVRYEPLLPLGTKLFIRGGPVRDSGYVWYEVATVSFDPYMAGWVAAADKGGEPWLAPSSYEPEPSPTAPPEPSEPPG